MIVHNPSDAPVLDYPIEDQESKKVYTWSIKPGETLEFPDYVGKYLLEIYNFLQRVVTKGEREAELEAAEKLRKGQHFTQVKIVEAPSGEAPKPDEVVNPGFKNENMGELPPDNLKPKTNRPAPVSGVAAQPVSPPVGSVVPPVSSSVPPPPSVVPPAASQPAPSPQPPANRTGQQPE